MLTTTKGDLVAVPAVMAHGETLEEFTGLIAAAIAILAALQPVRRSYNT